MRCRGLTQKGTACRNQAGPSGYCHLHAASIPVRSIGPRSMPSQGSIARTQGPPSQTVESERPIYLPPPPARPSFVARHPVLTAVAAVLVVIAGVSRIPTTGPLTSASALSAAPARPAFTAADAESLAAVAAALPASDVGGNLAAWRTVAALDSTNARYRAKVATYERRQAALDAAAEAKAAREVEAVADGYATTYSDPAGSVYEGSVTSSDEIVVTGRTPSYYRARVGLKTVYIAHSSLRPRGSRGFDRVPSVRVPRRRAPHAASSYSSGGGSRYITGPRGGCYYINRNGNKTYVDHSYCGR